MSIVVKHVTKYFGKVKAVDDLSFTLRPGEVTGLLGPNGAGKTTSVRLMSGYITPSAGTIEVNGVMTQRGDVTFRREIGYLPEDNPLYLDMTVADYLEFTAGLYGVAKEHRARRVNEMLDMFALGPVDASRIGKLSRGYRQRVGLAQTLIHDPDILIFDEPTTGLDPNQVIEFRRFVSELGKEKTIVFCTHNLAEVQALCDRVIIMSRGRILSDNSIAILQQDFQGGMQYFVAIESSGPANAEETRLALQTVECVKSVTRVSHKHDDDHTVSFHIEAERGSNVVKELFALCSSRGWHLVDVQRRRIKMEDIFHDLTRGRES